MKLLNYTEIRRAALKLVQEGGRKQFTRVSPDFIRRIERKTWEILVDEVHRHPSIGKTLK